MNEIISFSERLYRVKTTTDCFLVVVGKGKTNMSDKAVLTELCRCIVDLESEGRIITGVTALYPDGYSPRVAYRNSREYRRAKEEKERGETP